MIYGMESYHNFDFFRLGRLHIWEKEPLKGDILKIRGPGPYLVSLPLFSGHG